MFQTRSETNGLSVHESIDDALDRARNDPTVWKISFTHGKRFRLLRTPDDGVWEQHHGFDDFPYCKSIVDSFEPPGMWTEEDICEYLQTPIVKDHSAVPP